MQLKKSSGDDSIIRPTLVAVAVYLIILCILTGIARAENSNTGELGGELHCYLGVIGTLLVLFTLGFGVITSGRFGRLRHWKTNSLHLLFSIFVTLFLTGEFVFGLLKVQWSFTPNYHGIIGLSTVTVSWLSTLMSPCVAGRKINWWVSSKIHAILAVLLLLLILAQVLNGYLFLEE